jgi:hypothetical protein
VSIRKPLYWLLTTFVALVAATFTSNTAFVSSALAAPEAHVLRIDPRASSKSGDPVITTVIEVQQSKRISQATGHCATQSGDARLACMAEALEKPLYSTFPFPESNALFSVVVDGTDRPAKLLSVETWGKSQREPGVGTAWLVLIDADSRMGNSFDDAQELAKQFVRSMGPNDIVNLMFFNDRQVFSDSGWMPAARKSQAEAFVAQVTGTLPKQGRNRPLLTIIKNAATDGFKALGNSGEKAEIPMHQAMVVISTGYGGTDPSTTGPGALQLSEYMTNGRFPEDNLALPKTPVPVISVYIPTKTWDEFSNNSLEFMQNMSNPQIGGFFNILQDGESNRAANIVKAVRTRYSKMYLAKWRVSCVAPTITQTFRLVFKDVTPPIIGDASFQDVPMGIDPTAWPLDVNIERTQQSVGEGVHPGGALKVFGDFCWGGDSSRAEVYFLPAGQALPADLSGSNPEQAKEAQQQLIAMGMKGTALQSTDTFVEFTIPDNDKLLHGAGASAVARFVVYDNKARRMSGVTADTVVQTKARTAPFPVIMLAGVGLAVVIIALLLVVLLRSGNSRKRGGAQPAQRVAPAPSPARPPASSEPPAPANPSRAVIKGDAGVFTVVPGSEMRVGRDSNCAIFISQAQVSTFHASLKLEGGRLLVKDERSNNGTFVGGVRIAAGHWTEVPHGGFVKFGPEEFRARLE